MARTFPRRRCRICNGWFRPNPRKGDKQYACSEPECQLVRQIQSYLTRNSMNDIAMSFHRPRI